MVVMSSEEFARAYRQNSAEEWSPIPAVIVRYNKTTQEAVVRPLNKEIFRDNSTQELPVIHGVPIHTPRTAFAGIQLPVQVGDKVLLIFTMRSLDTLQASDLSGNKVPDQVSSRDNRFKQYEFCVGIAGFNDTNSAIGTDEDVRLLNNWKSHENEIRLTEDGSINIKNPKANLRLDISGEVKTNNENCEVVMSPEGEITSTNGSTTILMTPDGEVTITAPTKITIDTPTAHFKGEVISEGEIMTLARGGPVRLSDHLHGGVTPGPSITSEPVII